MRGVVPDQFQRARIVAVDEFDFRISLDRIGEIAVGLQSRRADIAAASTLATHGLPILLALAAGLVLAPLALYFTLADD